MCRVTKQDSINAQGHNFTRGAFTPCVLRRNWKGICCRCVRRRRGLRPPPPPALSCNTRTATVLSITTQLLPQRTSENGRRGGRSQRQQSPRRRRWSQQPVQRRARKTPSCTASARRPTMRPSTILSAQTKLLPNAGQKADNEFF